LDGFLDDPRKVLGTGEKLLEGVVLFFFCLV
jgi:hypothetical protein